MPILNWIGKEAVVNHDKEVPFRLLKKVKDVSVGEDSQNLIVHGDNLEGLKALMPYYYGKIKCIYIDPPYNTGNENWIYNDKVNSPKIKQWLGKVVGRDAEDLTRHDKWLSMMCPRLKLLKDLLKDEGVIFVSIDDNEQHHLRCLMDEIFGEENFVGMFKWNRVAKAPSLSSSIRTKYEYIISYSKGGTVKFFGKDSYNTQGPLWHLPNKRNELFFPAQSIRINQTFNKGNYGGTYNVELLDDLICENGLNKFDARIKAHSAWGQAKINQYIKDGSTFQIKKNPTTMYTTLSSEGNFIAPSDLLTKEECGIETNTDASDAMKEIGIPFDFPKPVSLVKYLVNMVTHDAKDAYILDSFAGSGTTAHAVMELNKADSGSRKFILVEMEDNIAKDITAERIKRVIKKYDYKDGFEYCELDKPLFNEHGQIDESCDFNQLATYIYFTETQMNIDKTKINGIFIGEDGATEYYLVYKEPKQNVLDRSLMKKLRRTECRKVVYADRCMIDDDTLKEFNLVFKQIPYKIKVY